MIQDTPVQKPILQQILDTMFETLAKYDDFDPVTIEKLKQLAAAGNLKKAPLVTVAIRVKPEGTK